MTSDKHVEEIFKILQQNVNINKINIKFVWEQAEKQKIHGKKQPSVKEIIRKNWDEKITFPEIYTYNDGNRSSLHAKVLIIDSKEILITSANLTGRGMKRNLEMGLLHTGKSAKEAETLIQTLIDERIITQV
jgi:phosphatidylserine/phosphatidylglycerophosphate/cardiolipin synthase-like enzyme